MQINNQNIVVVGLGVTGVACSRFLIKRGANVVITDNDKKNNDPLVQESLNMGVKLELGSHPDFIFENADLIVVSPGVCHNIKPLLKARDKGIKIIGEIELASKFIKEPIIGITGTNGKTTTTTLIGKMLEDNFKVFVGGNIGNPLIDYVDNSEKAQIVVAELSSFQLDTIDTFRPKIAVLLNITKDHLDRYDDFNSYQRSKERIFKNQKKDDVAIINTSCPNIDSIYKNIFSKKQIVKSGFCQDNVNINFNGAVVDDNTIAFYINGKSFFSLENKSYNLFGRHNKENIAAAFLSALSIGGSLDGIKNALIKFRGLSHRIEFVDIINNVKYFDDSKATNVDAVIKAIEAFDAPILLIIGGRDKKGGFHLLKDIVSEKVKKLIIIGESSNKIISELGHVSKEGYVSASSMEDAVLKADELSKAGDIVLLSPACSSFDMFTNYAQRGAAFCNAVKKLKPCKI